MSFLYSKIVIIHLEKRCHEDPKTPRTIKKVLCLNFFVQLSPRSYKNGALVSKLGTLRAE